MEPIIVVVKEEKIYMSTRRFATYGNNAVKYIHGIKKLAHWSPKKMDFVMEDKEKKSLLSIGNMQFLESIYNDL